MGKQVSSNSSLLAAGANIGVPNKSYVLDLLNAHNAYQGPGLLVAPEHNPLMDFIPQFFPGHVRVCPAVGGDRPFIGLRAIIDDGPNQLEVAVVTAADHACSVSRRGVLDQLETMLIKIICGQEKSCSPQIVRFPTAVSPPDPFPVHPAA